MADSVSSSAPSADTQQVVVTGRAIRSQKVKIRGPDGTITFEASAPLSESRAASYDQYPIVHLPTSLFSYRNTAGRRFTVTGKLVSRTIGEARQNARFLDFARTWSLPEFGTTGATPPILRIYGYGSKNIDNRPVILTSYEWAFNEDVDYIHSFADTTFQPMPIIGTLTLTLEEVYSAEEITDGKWRLSVDEGGGEFAGGGSDLVNTTRISLTGDRNFNKGFARGEDLSTPGSLYSIASSLQKNGAIRPTIPGVIAGALTRNFGSKVLNSSAITEVTRQLPPVIGNIFISGANVLIKEAGKAVTTTVSVGTGGTAPNPFDRQAGLLPPPIIE